MSLVHQFTNATSQQVNESAIFLLDSKPVLIFLKLSFLTGAKLQVLVDDITNGNNEILSGSLLNIHDTCGAVRHQPTRVNKVPHTIAKCSLFWEQLTKGRQRKLCYFNRLP